ncbi:MAG: PIN domain-containing protein [Acidimicrobiales bacterium]
MGRRAATHPRQPGRGSPLSAFVDTNVLVRHLTGEPADMAARATAFLAAADELLLTDLILAETIYVLESYKAPRPQIADAMRSLVAMDTMVTIDPATLLRAIEVYELDRVDFAEAYLVAQAESTGIRKIASFDKSIDRVKTVTRIEPPALPL